MIRCRATGLVYSNPTPHLRAIHAWHPSLVDLDDGRLLCTFDLGQAAESLDYATYAAMSVDGGHSWCEPWPLIGKPGIESRRSTHTIRVARLKSGKLLGMGARFYRDDPSHGLTNRATLGMVPMDVISIHSDDDGLTWSSPKRVEPPLVGPAFEICHAPKLLAGGKCLFPTQTWPDWDAKSTQGMRAVAFVSNDRGETWPEYLTVFDGRKQGVVHFEQSIVELDDGRLLAVAWAYDPDEGETLPTPFAIAPKCCDFQAEQPTGLEAQTAKLLALQDGRVLCVYRGHKRPGLWAQLVRIEEDQWINLGEQLIWEGSNYGASEPGDTSDKLSALKFGFPSLLQLSDGSVRIVFWCEEDSIHRIRWFDLELSESGTEAPPFVQASDSVTKNQNAAET
ncbi:sialidase family protein [Pirellulales bacterium]|nr:sialidase family protein [Pirellulales bacterium]